MSEKYIVSSSESYYTVAKSEVDGPTGLIVTYIEGGIRITWTDVINNAGDVSIYYSFDDGAYTLLDTVADGVETYDHIVAVSGTYKYKLRAKIL